jgi:hypothetical protein
MFLFVLTGILTVACFYQIRNINASLDASVQLGGPVRQHERMKAKGRDVQVTVIRTSGGGIKERQAIDSRDNDLRKGKDPKWKGSEGECLLQQKGGRGQ